MKTIISLAIACLLSLTACTITKNLQASTDCKNVNQFDKTANNGFYLVDPTMREPNENTAVIVGEPLVTFDDIESVDLYPDQDNQLSIYFMIDFDTGLKLSGITQHHISEYIALIINNKIVNVSQIQGAIGTSFISGRFDSNQEAKQIYSNIKCHIK